MGWMQKIFFLDRPATRTPEGARVEDGPTSAAPAVCGLILCVLILLDNSRSMHATDFPPSRIAAACQAVIEMLTLLLEKRPRSYVGIGAFSDDFHLCSEPLEVGKDFKRLVASLSYLGDSGSTEMKKGLQGIQSMMKSCAPGQKVIAITLTDGCCTGRSPTSTAEAIKAKGADIWTIGIGGSSGDVDEDLLKKIAHKPEAYRFIGNWDPQALLEAFRGVIGLYFPEEE
jgi:Mg-chelatase subunit ChlD